MNTPNGRLTGVKNAELIETNEDLLKVYDSFINQPSKWILGTQLDWQANGFILGNGYILVPSSKTKTTGDVVASISDYVLNFNDGRKTIVFTPEMKARIAAKDYSWLVLKNYS